MSIESLTLILAQINDEGGLHPSTFACIGAAQLLGGKAHVLICSGEKNVSSKAAEQAAGLEGVARVFQAVHETLSHPLAEPFAAVLCQTVETHGPYTHVACGANTFGKNILPRAAALCQGPLVADVIAIHDATTFTRPTYAGNVLEKIQSSAACTFLTLRPTAFQPAQTNEGHAEIVTASFAPPSDLPHVAFKGIQKAEGGEESLPLTSAKVVVSGGRGLQNGENFSLLKTLVNTLGGGAVGATRAAVDAGWVPNDMQVGQTGKVVAPELYIAVGLSGAAQHLAGMKDSKTIVAINKDENAPIFNVADYGLVADLFEAVPALIEGLKR